MTDADRDYPLPGRILMWFCHVADGPAHWSEPKRCWYLRWFPWSFIVGAPVQIAGTGAVLLFILFCAVIGWPIAWMGELIDGFRESIRQHLRDVRRGHDAR